MYATAGNETTRQTQLPTERTESFQKIINGEQQTNGKITELQFPVAPSSDTIESTFYIGTFSILSNTDTQVFRLHPFCILSFRPQS